MWLVTMRDFDENDVRLLCGNKVTDRARAACRAGRVMDLVTTGHRLSATVIDTKGRVHRPVVDLTDPSLGLGSAQPSCGCRSAPHGATCEHVATVLLKASDAAAAARVARDRRIAALLSPDAGGPGRPRANAMDPGVRSWMNGLRAVDKPPTADHVRIGYVLRTGEGSNGMRRFAIAPVLCHTGRDGGLVAQRGAFPHWAALRDASSLPVEIAPDDVRILRDLARLPQASGDYRFLDADGGWELLSAIAATGRGRAGDLDRPTLTEGPQRSGRVEWSAIGSGGTYAPCLKLGDGSDAGEGAPPLYIDWGTGLVGPVETGLAPRLAAGLLRAPHLDRDAIRVLHAEMGEGGATLLASLPPKPVIERVSGVRPVPCLSMSTVKLPSRAIQHQWGYHVQPRPDEVAPVAEVSFAYGDVSVPVGTRVGATVLDARGREVEVDRDMDAEAAALRELMSLGYAPLADGRDAVPARHARAFSLGQGSSRDWSRGLCDAVPRLESMGWRTSTAGDFPLVIVGEGSAIDAEVRKGSGIDWLELHLGMDVGGVRVDIVAAIVSLVMEPSFTLDDLEGEALVSGRLSLLPLGDGRTLAMPADRLLAIVRAVRDLTAGADLVGGGLRLGRTDAARLAEFEAATADALMTWRGGDAVRALGRRLLDHAGIPPVEVPGTFASTLRPYQREGVAWLSLLREVGLGGVLADDMGLGKTVQALAFLCVEKAAGRLDRPALVVAPTSLMKNWADEAARHAPDLRVLTLHGPGRLALFPAIGDHDLVLTTYPLVARDRGRLASQGWHVVLLDEAQTIKNPDAQTSQSVASLDARHRFCLTGTPLENHLGELWSIMSISTPGLLGDRKRFAAAWRTPIERGGDGERGRLLARRVRPFMLRRTKAQVANDLPPKTTMVERIDMEQGQRDVYEAVRVSMHDKVRQAIADKGMARSRIVILDALLKLRQACCDPRLVKSVGTGQAGSAKLDRLEAMLAELLGQGRRVLVFSSFTSMLDLIRPRLDAAGITHVSLTGSTRDRPRAIATFDGGDAQVFLISLKAGGAGLNLVSADTVIIYEPWWNPAVEDQAVDRAHRIGQRKPVFVHKLTAAGTIEEKMEVLKARKAALAQSLFEGDGKLGELMTEADVEMLLAS